MATPGDLRNALTFDVEDWFQGLELPHDEWRRFESRVAIGLRAVLDILDEKGIRATFFVLGRVAEEQPCLVEAIAAAGHEIGTHGWTHTPLYRQTPAEFREELCRSIAMLERVTGRAITAHRAPFFSITRETPWAFRELERAGICHDSSIFPIHNYRYGVPGARRFPHRLAGSSLLEFPISTLRIGPVNVPFSGGFYARALPYTSIRWALRRLNRAGHPAIVYFHPWEFDCGHPHLRGQARWLARMTHYHALSTTIVKLRKLLDDFRWGPMGDVLQECSV